MDTDTGPRPVETAAEAVTKLADAMAAQIDKANQPKPVDTKEGALKEYGAIRDEIRSTETSILTVIGFMLGATALVMGQGITNKAPYVFVVPMWLMVITSFYVADKRWVIWTLAIYQRARFESKGYGQLWETTLAEFREGCKTIDPTTNARRGKGLFVPAVNIMFVEAVMVSVIVLANLVLFWFYIEPQFARLGNLDPVWGRVEYLVPLGSACVAWLFAYRHYARLKDQGGANAPLYNMFLKAVADAEELAAKSGQAGTAPPAAPSSP